MAETPEVNRAGGKQENSCLLTWKNLYRILMARDYPVYTSSVISESCRRGITLLQFWKEIIPESWKDGPYGRRIWRRDGGWSRYPSELCNRSPAFPYYAEYMAEISKWFDEEAFLRLGEAFSRFLSQRKYHASSFFRRISVFVDRLCTEDAALPPELIPILRRACHLQQESRLLPQLFWDGWVLALLTYWAAAGPEMNRIHQDLPVPVIFLQPEALYGMRRGDSAAPPLRFLTRGMTELTADAVSSTCFFGRETALFDLQDALRRNKKVLICGMGGVGKTELARQLLYLPPLQKTWDRVAAVQYADSLERSLSSAFSSLEEKGAEERFHEAVYLLRREGAHCLLMIDNAEYLAEEKLLWQELSLLPGPVLITSRDREFPGFEALPLDMLSPEASLLLLRQHYASPLSEGEKGTLLSLFQNRAWNHPLTIRFLGRQAREKGWTCGQLEAFWQDLLSGSQGGTRQEDFGFSRICGSLRSPLSLRGNEKKLALTLALLPMGIYPYPLWERMFGAPDGKSPKNPAYIEKLARKGWIQSNEQGISMHPLIAESLRTLPIREKQLPQLWMCLRETMQSPDPAQAEKAAESALHAADLLREDISGNLMTLCVAAARILHDSAGLSLQNARRLRHILGRCRDVSLEQEASVACLTAFAKPKESCQEMEKCLHRALKEKLPRELISQLGEELLIQSFTLDQPEKNRALLDLLRQEDFSFIPLMEEWLFLSEAIRNTQQKEMGYHMRRMTAAYETFSAEEKAGLFSIMQNAYFNVISLLLAYGVEGEKARSLFQDYQRIASGTPDSAGNRLVLLSFQALFAEAEKDYDAAIRWKKETVDLCEKYYGIYGDYEHFLNDYARLLNVAGRSAEAVSAYEQLIARGVEGLQTPQRYAAILGNAAVAYLELRELDRAEALFRESYELTNRIQDIGCHAHQAYGLARICRERGDSAGELRYLRETYPILLETLGEGYRKTAEVRQRLEVLDPGFLTENPSNHHEAP